MSQKKYLVLGSGGREHAIVWHLKKQGVDVYAAPGSDAIQTIAPCFPFSSFEDLAAQIKKRGIDEIIVGPEKYLAEGVSDFFEPLNVPVFGPKKLAAQLETDKTWAKDFCVRHKIPTAQSRTIERPEDLPPLFDQFRTPYVLKASGLAAGKGVWIGSDRREAENFVRGALAEHPKVLMEEFIAGEELSFFILIDGNKYAVLGAAQDHKRLLENDAGPNTGGMGAYSPTPILTPELQDRIAERVIKPVLKGLQRDGIAYRGFLFLGLMISNGEPFVLEFNCRLGDPETQSLMLRLETPLTHLIDELRSQNPAHASLSPEVSLNVVVAAKGYPESPLQGFALPGIDSPPQGIFIFHSGTRRKGQEWEAHGGRLFSVNTRQSNLLLCQNTIYPWIESLTFQDQVTYRRDIGVRAFTHLRNVQYA